MSECMQFPDTWEEFEQAYGFEDKKEIYTNGSRLIQSFRVIAKTMLGEMDRIIFQVKNLLHGCRCQNRGRGNDGRHNAY